MKPLLTIEEPPQAAPRGFALFALGFRPFYLLASLFAALSIPLSIVHVVRPSARYSRLVLVFFDAVIT